MNIGRLWSPVRFVGHKSEELRKSSLELLNEMNERVFGKETAMQKIVKENKKTNEEKNKK